MKPEPSPQPSAPGVVRFYSFLPQGERFSEDVLAGLALPQKSIPPKYFYDEQGCRLFEAICELPEYYLTRTETAILRGNIAEIAQFVGPEAQLIEFGSGGANPSDRRGPQEGQNHSGCRLLRSPGRHGAVQPQPCAPDQPRARGGFPGEALPPQGLLRPDPRPRRDAPGEPVLAVRARRRPAVRFCARRNHPYRNFLQVLGRRIPGAGQTRRLHSRKSLDRSRAVVQRPRDDRGLSGRRLPEVCVPRAGSVLRAVDDEALVEIVPLFVVVDRLLRIHDLDGSALAYQAPHRRVVVLVRRHAVHFHVEALAVGQHVVVKERRGVGVGRAPRDRDRGGQHDGWRQNEPVDRRRLGLHTLGVVAVDAEHQRNLARRDQDGAVIVTGANRQPVVGHAPEQLEPPFLAERFDQSGEPFHVRGFHADALFPFRVA